MRSPWHEAPRRRATWFALIVAVLAVHLAVGVEVAVNVIGVDAGAEPQRIDVSLVQELAPTAPPPPPAAAPPAARGARPARGVRAASAPEPEPEPVASTPEEAASASHAGLRAEALALAASMAEAAASAPEAPIAAASAALAPASSPIVVAAQPALEWPPSTRLSYTLSGLFRNGPLYGDGVVEWRRDGLHYQVEFDFSVQPFLDGHMFSDGEITPDGLQPVHYDEWRKFPLRDRLVRRIEFGDDAVLLNNGTRVARLPQTQDPSSQFVQFVWMFTAHPEWLRTDNVVSVPLALPNTLRVWHYRVGASETLQLPFGAIDAVHLAPIDPRKPNELAFEIWIAPTLQYLPVRIHVPLNDENFADLTLSSRPLQAAAPAASQALAPRPASAPMTLP